MHNTLVHALGQGTQGPEPKKGAWAGPRAGPRPFWVPCVYTEGSLVYTQEISCARDAKRARPFWVPDTRDLVYTQEISCVYTGDSLVYTQEIFCVCTILGARL